jgi:hypothetical protein
VSAANSRQQAFLRRPQKKRPYGRLLLILGFLFVCYIYLGGDYGLTHRLRAEQLDLKQECVRLETDSLYIEKKAREELGMVRKGERVYQFVPRPDSTGNQI